MAIDIDDNLPLSTIFVLILIISAGFILQIFPCRLQNALNNNMYLKHLLGFFTLLFIVVLNSSLKNRKDIVLKSLVLYIFFILLTKTDYNFLIVILILLGLSYVIFLEKDRLEKHKDNNSSELATEENTENKINFYENAINIIYIVIILITFVGVLVYMGEKKLEYKKSFNYITFFIGKTDCKNTIKSAPIIKSLKHAFD